MIHGRAVDVVPAETCRCRREQRNLWSPRWTEPEAKDRALGQKRAARICGAIAALPNPERDTIVSVLYGKRTYREAKLVLEVLERTVNSGIGIALIRRKAGLGDLSWPHDDHAA